MKKQKTNKNLINVSFTIDKRTAELFKKSCKDLRITQKSVIEKAMKSTIKKDDFRCLALMKKDLKRAEEQQERTAKAEILEEYKEINSFSIEKLKHENEIKA